MFRSLSLLLLLGCASRDVSPALEQAAIRAALQTRLEAAQAEARGDAFGQGGSVRVDEPRPSDLVLPREVGGGAAASAASVGSHAPAPEAPVTGADTAASSAADPLAQLVEGRADSAALTRAIDELRWTMQLEARLADKQRLIDRVHGGDVAKADRPAVVDDRVEARLARLEAAETGDQATSEQQQRLEAQLGALVERLEAVEQRLQAVGEAPDDGRAPADAALADDLRRLAAAHEGLAERLERAVADLGARVDAVDARAPDPGRRGWFRRSRPAPRAQPAPPPGPQTVVEPGATTLVAPAPALAEPSSEGEDADAGNGEFTPAPRERPPLPDTVEQAVRADGLFAVEGVDPQRVSVERDAGGVVVAVPMEQLFRAGDEPVADQLTGGADTLLARLVEVVLANDGVGLHVVGRGGGEVDEALGIRRVRALRAALVDRLPVARLRGSWQTEPGASPVVQFVFEALFDEETP